MTSCFNLGIHQLILDTPGSLRCHQRLIGKKRVDTLPTSQWLSLGHQMPRGPIHSMPALSHEGIPHSNKSETTLMSYVSFLQLISLQSTNKSEKIPHNIVSHQGLLPSWPQSLKSHSGTHAIELKPDTTATGKIIL